jgi:hypothetical protein
MRFAAPSIAAAHGWLLLRALAQAGGALLPQTSSAGRSVTAWPAHVPRRTPQEAYSVLRNPAKREQYDRTGTA